MNKAEFNERMNRKDLDEIAEDRIAAYLSADCEDDNLLFNGIDDRFIDSEDLVFIRSVLIEELNKISQSENDELITDPFEQKLVHLMYTLREANTAMESTFVKMLHSIRAECDYSGLGMLYEACNTSYPFEIYQQIGSMIFSDFYKTWDLDERTEASPRFVSFYEKFDKYFNGLLEKAEAAWAAYHHSLDEDNEDDDNDGEEEELTYERFQRMFAEAKENSIDFPLVSDVHKRMLKVTALLMAYSEAMELNFEGYVFEKLNPTNQWAIHYTLQMLQSQNDATYDDYCSVCQLLLERNNNGDKKE